MASRPGKVGRQDMANAMAWIFRLVLTAFIAAVMAVVGYQFIFTDDSERWKLDGQSFYFVVPSVLLWLVLAPVLRRQNYVSAVGWGLLSPLIGSLLAGGPAGPLLVLVMWYAAFPIGILTGVLVKLCVSLGSKRPTDPLHLTTRAHDR
jgi:hypothetical protein